jgi:hypothetical protein
MLDRLLRFIAGQSAVFLHLPGRATVCRKKEKEKGRMTEKATLHDAFLDELRDLYDAEKQLTKLV